MPTTATEWLNDHPGDVESLVQLLVDSGTDIELLTDLPPSMQKEIASQLADTFQQDYWLDIHNTTMGDATTSLQKGLNDGWSIRKIAESMRDNFIDPNDPEGTKKYARRRSINIARTEAGHALNGARKASMNTLMEEMGGQVPMRPSWLSVLGATTRDTHAALDGVPADENGLWDLAGYMVPWPGYTSLPAELRCNCQCQPGFAKVSPIGKLVAISRMFYSGPLVELVTKSGSRIYFTPNHPVLTSEGWVGASQVKAGMHLFQDATGVSLGEDEKYEPISIEGMFQSCCASMGCVESRRRFPFQFHGDAKHGQGKIDTILVDVELANPSVAEGFQNGKELDFVFAASELGVSQASSSVAGTGVFPSDELGSRIGSQQTMTFKASVDDRSGDPVSVSDFDLAFSGQVSRQDRSFIQRDAFFAGFATEVTPRRPNVDSKSFQSDKDRMGITPIDFGDGCGRSLFVDIQPDEVIGVGLDLDFSGHVYDIQTESGVYWSQSIIAHNCTISMELGMQQEDAQRLINEYGTFREEYGLAKGLSPCGCEVKHLPGQHNQQEEEQ